MINPSFITNRAGGAESLAGRHSLVLFGRVIVLFTLAVSVGTGAMIRASDDDDLGDVAIKEQQLFLSEEMFDQILLRGNAIPAAAGGRRVSSARERIELSLTTEIETIDHECSLTETQLKKLQLAGRGDIVRYLDQVTELRRKYTMVALDQQQYLDVSNQLQALSTTFVFVALQETSLFRKTLRTTLNDEQLAKYQLIERGRKVSVVESAFPTSGRPDSNIKLTGETRQKLIDTLVTHGHIPLSPHPYNKFIVLLEAARLEHLVKELLTEAEWQTMEALVKKARQLEPTLRRSGQWPVPPIDEEEDIPSDGAKG